MALRVLLADESATIKKVMQISLQDFAVDVRAVQLGIDVLQVVQQFQPDIIFIDILLQKKNGYEVSQELKKDPTTRTIPVVLMWSGFMEVDVAKLKSSMADGQLEKPFDADGLRRLIYQMVPKTQTHKLAQHLVFPAVPKIESSSTSITKTQPRSELELERSGPATLIAEVAKQARAPAAKTQLRAETEPSWSMDSFEDLGQFETETETEEFQKVGLNKLNESSARAETNTKTDSDTSTGSELALDLSGYNEDDGDNDDDKWVQKDLSSFKVDLPEGEDEPIALDFDLPQEDLEDLINTETKPMKRVSPLLAEKAPAHQNRPNAGANRDIRGSPAALTVDQIEKIIREQSQEIIEKVVQKLVPDIASRLIKDEIRRLLDEAP